MCNTNSHYFHPRSVPLLSSSRPEKVTQLLFSPPPPRPVSSFFIAHSASEQESGYICSVPSVRSAVFREAVVVVIPPNKYPIVFHGISQGSLAVSGFDPNEFKSQSFDIRFTACELLVAHDSLHSPFDDRLQFARNRISIFSKTDFGELEKCVAKSFAIWGWSGDC